jgi:antiviral helicase SKI2
LVHTEKQLTAQISNLEHVMSDQNLELLPDYFQRIEGSLFVFLTLVLKTIGFIAQDSTVQLKGRVACEINTADEVILTELILDNVLAEFTPQEIVAVCIFLALLNSSCLALCFRKRVRVSRT